MTAVSSWGQPSQIPLLAVLVIFPMLPLRDGANATDTAPTHPREDRGALVIVI